MTTEALPDRRLQIREETRRAILASAQEILVERGLDGFSMRILAARCGCTAATLYHYFADKERLIDELLDLRLEGLNRELEAVHQSGDARTDLERLLGAFARFCLENPDHYQLLVSTRTDERELASAETSRRLLLAPLESFAGENGFSPEDGAHLQQLIWCFVHGMVLMRASRPDGEWAPDLLERGLDALISGTRARATSKEPRS